jgi:hypothetical protein
MKTIKKHIDNAYGYRIHGGCKRSLRAPLNPVIRGKHALTGPQSFLSTLILAFGLSGMALATPITYENTVTFSSNNVLQGAGTFSWSHDMPADFEVPPDVVESATLAITSKRAAGGNDFVSIIDFGNLGALDATGNSAVLTNFNLGLLGVFSAWALNDSLDLSLAYTQGTGNSNTLTMVSSKFTLIYTPGTLTTEQPVTPQAAVPEPEGRECEFGVMESCRST